MKAKASSGLPVYYEVDYGPAVIEGGKLKIFEIPTRARFPIACKVTACQIGRRVEPKIEAADAVSVEFAITGSK